MGEVVDTDMRAEMLAEYYERVQWAVRPTTASMRQHELSEELPVNMGPIQWTELKGAAMHLKNNRASGVDDLPGEFWRLILIPGSKLALWALDFCQTCWQQRQVPSQWHLARVSAIFKGGDSTECNNYHPISLLSVAYKMFAHILLERLKAAGAENRIRRTQYGFKSKSSTTDALFVTRRVMDAAWAAKDGSLLLLALDWSKAFDCICPGKLMIALRRFGLPPGFIQMVEGIYNDK